MAEPTVDTEVCIGCGACADACPCDVLEVQDGVSTVADPDSCIECGVCTDECPTGAITQE